MLVPLQRLTTADAYRLMSTTSDGFVMKRDSPNIDPPDSQTLAVMCVSLSLATISVVSALFAFYWFVRMRRGFRQDMIMLLIQSDMAKTLWLLINPLFYFITKKPFSSNWAFCQVSGFLLTVTIEASDIAVLLIAIHTALFIVKRQHPGVALGLQPYRRVAYTLWATLPFVLAAIVPITGNSFVDNGSYCYLPLSPSWYHNALAWVPRYIILGFIVVTYAWLYLYVYLRVRSFGEDQRRASTLSTQSNDSSTRRRLRRKWRSHSVPPTPLLVTHNLLDSPQTNTYNNDPSKLRQHSAASTISTLQIGESVSPPAALTPVVRKSSIAWNLVDFGRDGNGTTADPAPYLDTVPSSPTTKSLKLSSDTVKEAHSEVASTGEPSLAAPKPTHNAADEYGSSRNPRETRRGKRGRRFAEIRPRDSDSKSRNSAATIIAALRQGPPRTGEGDRELLSSSSSSVHLPTEVSEAGMRRSREKMQRQMRLLFVYPAIYALTWIAPFAAHVYRHHDPSYMESHQPGNGTAAAFSGAALGMATVTGTGTVHAPTPAAASPESLPLALRVASVASLCVGAAVDCGFFTAWERPWRHLRGGFWENLAARLRIHRLCGDGGAGERTGGPGRSRDERVADERAARTRRDREREMGLRSKMEAAAAIAAAAAGSSNNSTAGGRSSAGEGGTTRSGGASAYREGKRREWWDVLDDASL